MKDLNLYYKVGSSFFKKILLKIFFPLRKLKKRHFLTEKNRDFSIFPKHVKTRSKSEIRLQNDVLRCFHNVLSCFQTFPPKTIDKNWQLPSISSRTQHMPPNSSVVDMKDLSLYYKVESSFFKKSFSKNFYPLSWKNVIFWQKKIDNFHRFHLEHSIWLRIVL